MRKFVADPPLTSVLYILGTVYLRYLINAELMDLGL